MWKPQGCLVRSVQGDRAGPKIECPDLLLLYHYIWQDIPQRDILTEALRDSSVQTILDSIDACTQHGRLVQGAVHAARCFLLVAGEFLRIRLWSQPKMRFAVQLAVVSMDFSV